MLKRHSLYFFIGLVFIIIFIVGCKSQRTTENIKIGVIAPLTGGAAELGEHIRNGLELANKNLDYKYAPVYEDDKCIDTKAALSAAQKFIDIDKIRLVIGPLCAPAYQAVSSVFNQNGVVFMHTSGVTPPFIESSGKFGIPGITTTIHLEDAYLADFIFNDLGIKKMAVLVWDEEWAVEHRKGFVKRFEDLGGQIVFDETFTIDETQFKTFALKIRGSGAEGVFIVALNFQNANIVKQFKEMDLNIKIFGQFEIEDPAFLNPSGNAAEGIIYVYPKIDKTKPEINGFILEYKEKYGSEPNYYSYIGYDSLKLYDWAIKQCNGLYEECIISKIRSVKDFPGVSGSMTFGEDGMILRDFEIKTIKNGEFTVYK